MEPAERVDFLVMGAGVAGLRAAVELARHGDLPAYPLGQGTRRV